MGNPKVQKEILDAIDIMVRKRMENVPQILFGVTTEVLGGNKCNVTINTIGHQLKYYGDIDPTPNKKYPVFVPASGMSQAFIITGDSGGIDVEKKATIVVSYPVGAVCTAYNELGRTYEALDTSGSAVFTVSSGTWTIEAREQAKVVTQTVTVEDGGWVEVKLTFDLLLFSEGVDNIDVTGGFVAVGGNNTPVTLSVVDRNLTYVQSPHPWGESCASYIGPNNKIDLTDYSTFEITVVYLSSTSSGVMGVGSEKNYGSISGSGCAMDANSVNTFQLDISDKYGEYYVGWGAYVASGNYTFKFSEFKLIP